MISLKIGKIQMVPKRWETSKKGFKTSNRAVGAKKIGNMGGVLKTWTPPPGVGGCPPRFSVLRKITGNFSVLSCMSISRLSTNFENFLINLSSRNRHSQINQALKTPNIRRRCLSHDSAFALSLFHRPFFKITVPTVI